MDLNELFPIQNKHGGKMDVSNNNKHKLLFQLIDFINIALICNKNNFCLQIKINFFCKSAICLFLIIILDLNCFKKSKNTDWFLEMFGMFGIK